MLAVIVRRAGLFAQANALKGPFVAIHFIAIIGAFFVPLTWMAIGLCVITYLARMFFVTAFFHRYFSHRSYKTSRLFQFLMATLGCTCMQKGPLWWAANHRRHHKYSDTEDDPHSPIRHGVFWSHMGWVLANNSAETDREIIKDFAKYPELRVLEKVHWLPGLGLAFLCYSTLGWSGLIWGFFVSTVLVYHASFCVNSVCHIFGVQRYKTGDASRNNALVAILTLGEGWHNNHHHYQSSANQGFKWWEIDISYYGLCCLRLLFLVWDLRRPPPDKLMPAAA